MVAGSAILQICLDGGVQMSSNNLPGLRYKKVTGFKVPQIEARILLADADKKTWIEVGRIASGFSSDLYSAPKGWLQDAEEQEAFLLEQDKLTGRLAFMIGLKKKSTPLRNCLRFGKANKSCRAVEVDERILLTRCDIATHYCAPGQQKGVKRVGTEFFHWHRHCRFGVRR